MSRLKVLVDNKETLLRDALDVITDSWLRQENYSIKTIMDLRDVCKTLLDIQEALLINLARNKT